MFRKYNLRHQRPKLYQEQRKDLHCTLHNPLHRLKLKVPTISKFVVYLDQRLLITALAYQESVNLLLRVRLDLNEKRNCYHSLTRFYKEQNPNKSQVNYLCKSFEFALPRVANLYLDVLVFYISYMVCFHCLPVCRYPLKSTKD